MSTGVMEEVAMSTGTQQELERAADVSKGVDLNSPIETKALLQIVNDAHTKHEQQVQGILREFHTQHERSLASAVDRAVEKAVAMVAPVPSEMLRNVTLDPEDLEREDSLSALVTPGQGRMSTLSTMNNFGGESSDPSNKQKRSHTTVSTASSVKGTLFRGESFISLPEEASGRNFVVQDNNHLSANVAAAALAEEHHDDFAPYDAMWIGKSSKYITKHPWFDYVVAGIILANAAVIAVQTDMAAQQLNEYAQTALFSSIDLFFTIFFALELVLRVIVEKRRFLFGHNAGWNFFDTFVVMSALLEHLLQSSTNATAIRVLRIMRLVRVIRVIRTLRMFEELRAMVKGIMLSSITLLWALVLLWMILFVFSVFITQMVTSHRRQEQLTYGADTDQDFADLNTHFGSLFLTMYSLYKAITGGDDWAKFADLLFHVSSTLGFFFCFYIAFAVFAVLNVITGVFVDNAIKGNQSDADTIISEQNEARKKHVKEVRKIFRKADLDSSGKLDFNEFQNHFSNPYVQAYFRHIGLEIEEGGARALFKLLDFDESGTIDAEEFIFGCGHLKGYAKSFDMARMHAINSKVIARLDRNITKVSGEQNDRLQSVWGLSRMLVGQLGELREMYQKLEKKIDNKLDNQASIDHSQTLMNKREATKVEDTNSLQGSPASVNAAMQMRGATDIDFANMLLEHQKLMELVDKRMHCVEATIGKDVAEEVVKRIKDVVPLGQKVTTSRTEGAQAAMAKKDSQAHADIENVYVNIIPSKGSQWHVEGRPNDDRAIPHFAENGQPEVVHQATGSWVEAKAPQPWGRMGDDGAGPPIAGSAQVVRQAVGSLVEEAPQHVEMTGVHVSNPDQSLIEEAPQPSEMPIYKNAHELVGAAHSSSPAQRSPELRSPQACTVKSSKKPWDDTESGSATSQLASLPHAAGNQTPLDLWQDLVQVLWRWRPKSADQ